MYLHTKTVSTGQGFRKLEHKQHRQTDRQTENRQTRPNALPAAITSGSNVYRKIFGAQTWKSGKYVPLCFRQIAYRFQVVVYSVYRIIYDSESHTLYVGLYVEPHNKKSIFCTYLTKSMK